MKRDESTYGSIRDRFDEFLEIQKEKPVLQRQPALPAQQPYTPQPETGQDMGKSVFMGIGVGIGVLLLLLAGVSLAAALRWQGVHHNGAFVGYVTVTFFLLLAGAGGIAATLNHNLRVLGRPGGHH